MRDHKPYISNGDSFTWVDFSWVDYNNLEIEKEVNVNEKLYE